MLVIPSPNDHVQVSTGGPCESSNSVTVKGGVPKIGIAWKFAASGGGDTVIECVCVKTSLPVGPATSNVTVYTPGSVYVWVGCWCVDVILSPNSQDQVSMSDADVSVKVTVKGAVPEYGSKVNWASGIGAMVKGASLQS